MARLLYVEAETLSIQKTTFCYNGAMGLPCVQIAPQAAKRLRNYDCWVFRDEVTHVDESLNLGDVAEVVDGHGTFVAYAFYSPHSHIALRVVSTVKDQPVDRGLLVRRLKEAIARRRTVTRTNAKRLVFSEADGLPGLIVDQYGEYLIVQVRSAGMERLRSSVVDLLQELLHPKGVLERSDKEFREEEGLEPVNQLLRGEVPDRILIEEEGLRFWVDPHRGLKTGFYLDQRTSRRRLRELVQPDQRFLDAFSYTGSLGIAAATRGAQVTCVEQHEPFLELAKENAALNGVADRIEWVAGNAFYWLEAQAGAQRQVDWVCLDPPALAKNKTHVVQARQALHHLVRHALAMLGPGGLLALCMCTYHLLNLVEEIVRIAAAEQKVRLSVREQWLQGADHPWILQIPPTRYLTSWLFERDAQSAV